MIEKHDNDWEEACREISEHAPEHYEALTSIQPFMPKPAGNRAGTPSVYFTQEKTVVLDSIIKKLPEKTANYCPVLLRLHAKAYSILPQELSIAEQNKIPVALMEEHITPRMDWATLSALMSTCSFFYTRQSLRTQRDRIPKYQICADNNYTLIYSHNKLLVCGNNYHGQLGLGHTVSQPNFTLAMVLQKGEAFVQVIAENSRSLILTSQNRLLVCGEIFDDQPKRQQLSFIDALAGVLKKREYVLQVFAKDSHIAVLTNQNRLLMCGKNICGQLGLRTVNQSTFSDALTGVLQPGEAVLQVFAEKYHSMVLTSQNRLLACGYNNYGQLGNISNLPGFSDALAGVLQPGETVLQVVAREFRTAVLTSQHRLLLWGKKSSCQPGPGHTKERHRFMDALAGVLSQEETVLQVFIEAEHTMVLTNQNRLLVCRSNYCSKPRLGDTDMQLSFIDVLAKVLQQGEAVLQVVVEVDHTLVLTSQNRLLVCGYNYFGQLGLGDADRQLTFIDALAGVLLNGEAVLQVLALVDHTMVLTSQNRLLVSGNNCHGPLGLKNTGTQRSFIDALAEVLVKGETVLQVVAKINHTLILTSQQRLLLCGNNSMGQLGLGHSRNQFGFAEYYPFDIPDSHTESKMDSTGKSTEEPQGESDNKCSIQ